MDFFGHLKTVNYHRRLVRQGCFAVGLYFQGLTHDLSKYSPREFLVGVRYYQGNRSPNTAEREAIGYSSSWLHHKGRNRHHFEYWVDYSRDAENGILPAPMPDRYIAEMFMDRIAACKVYQGKDYSPEAPLDYYLRGDKMLKLINPDTRQKLELLLNMMAERGEDYTFAFIRQKFLHTEGRYRAMQLAERIFHSAADRIKKTAGDGAEKIRTGKKL